MNVRKVWFSLLLITLSAAVQPLLAQRSRIHTEPDKLYKDAVELYQKEKYAAAYTLFGDFMENGRYGQRQSLVDAEYFRAVCATELFYNNAGGLLTDFIRSHPESPLSSNAYFHLGKVAFRAKDYKKASQYFDQADPNTLSRAEWYEYYYKSGYSAFENKDYKKALNYFVKIKDAESVYRVPATYYYAHIRYVEQNWNEALKAFKSIENEKAFRGLVPYYIAQIYYMQKKYEDVISYARPLADTVKGKNSANVYRILAESYYNTGRFKESLEFYDKYAALDELDRLGNYRYGTALYKSGAYEAAYERLKLTVAEEDSVSQTAYYLLADCAYRTGDKRKAADAFKMAYKLNFDRNMAEDALFNFAKLSYETDYDPYNEAIRALKDYLDKYPESKRADEAYSFLAEVFMTVKSYKDALETLDKIKRKDPRLKQARQRVAFLYGTQFFEEGNYAEAINYFNQASASGLNDVVTAQSIFWTAESYYRTGRMRDAEEGFSEFLNTPGAMSSGLRDDAYYNLGYIYFKDKKYAAAGVEFRKFADNRKASNPQLAADAYNRAGDCYYAQREWSKALEYYDKAYAIKKADPDYSLLQKATILGLQKKHGEKMTLLTKLRTDYPNSVYTAETMYESGVALQSQGKKNEALTYFEQVIQKYPNGPFAKKAYLKLGLHYYNQDQDEKALSYYKPVLERFPGTPEADEAIKYVKFIYIDEGRIDEFTDFMRSVSGVDYTESSLDSVAFRAGENKYLAGDCAGSIMNFNQYISKFPTGTFIKNARYYRAECLREQKKEKEALADYEYLIENTPNDYLLLSLERASDIAFKEKDWERVRKYAYENERLSEKANVRQTSMERILLAEYELANYPAAATYAAKVYESDKSAKEVKEYAALLAARSETKAGNATAAEIWWKKLQGQSSAIGAEAKYNIYTAMFARGEYKQTEKKILADVNSLSNYGLWMGKSFIILGEVYAKLENFDQSIATLQSVIDNAEDAAVVEEARLKLEEVKTAQRIKNQPANNNFEFDLNGN